MKKLFLFSILYVIFFAVENSYSQNIKQTKFPIVNGRATYLPKPDLSQEARDFCASGKVEVEVLISENGSVIKAEAISGDDLLLDSAVEAVKKAKFSPTAEIRVETRGIVVYNFLAEKKCIVLNRFVNKRALNIPKPEVTNLNRQRHLQIKEDQTVTIQIVVDESGKVIYAKAISGNPLLRGACENSARQAKFAPTFIDPGPIKVKALLTYKFKPDGTIEF